MKNNFESKLHLQHRIQTLTAEIAELKKQERAGKIWAQYHPIEALIFAPFAQVAYWAVVFDRKVAESRLKRARIRAGETN